MVRDIPSEIADEGDRVNEAGGQPATSTTPPNLVQEYLGETGPPPPRTTFEPGGVDHPHNVDSVGQDLVTEPETEFQGEENSFDAEPADELGPSDELNQVDDLATLDDNIDWLPSLEIGDTGQGQTDSELATAPTSDPSEATTTSDAELTDSNPPAEEAPPEPEAPPPAEEAPPEPEPPPPAEGS